MRRIAVLTSGGDAPGMNGAIRAVVRIGIERGWEVFGVRQGFAGLIAGDFAPLCSRDVSGILQRGGTMLGSARSLEFKTESGQQRALQVLGEQGIDGLVVIGGNGSQAGACTLWRKGFPVVGVASTIDNDLWGTEIAIGVDTALNIALEAIDRLKVTASSHQRAFLVEVMGRQCGYLALVAGIAGGAEVIIIPEMDTDPEEVVGELRAAYQRGKAHAIVVVAEGARYNSEELAKYCREHSAQCGFELRVTKLGHVQRGGDPGVFDRILATRLGAAAVELLDRGEWGRLAGWARGEVAVTPLDEVAGAQKELDLRLWELARILSR